MILLEKRGIPACGICTEPFGPTVRGNARALGLPDAKLILVPHPFGTLSTGELEELARSQYPAIISAIVRDEEGTDGSKDRN